MKRIRLYFLALLLLLSLPFFLLVLKTRRDFQRDLFLSLRTSAEGIAADVRLRMIDIFRREANRPFTEYRFFQAGSPQAKSTTDLHPSPLSEFPVRSEVPGIVGYFQIDPDRTFHTPLLPDRAGAKIADSDARMELQSKLFQIVSSALLTSADKPMESTAHPEILLKRTDTRFLNDLFSARASLAPASGENAELLLQESDVSRPKLQSNSMEQLRAFDARPTRKEDEGHYVRFSSGRTLATEPEVASLAAKKSKPNKPADRPLIVRNEAAVTEIDPFQVSLAESHWLVFFRSVWWEERRYIQGFVAAQKEFLDATIVRATEARSRSAEWHYFVLHRDDVVQEGWVTPTPSNKPHLVYWTSAPYPLSAFSMAFSVDHLPRSRGASLVTLFSLVFGLLLCGSLYATYRMAAAQMDLSAKKSDFVSAVSHELRTPLTSIRMYGDLLTQGWADVEKRATYLKFIRDESERLSRLIENVLQIARLERGEWALTLNRQNPAPLVKACVEKMHENAERSGLKLIYSLESPVREVVLDTDAFTQIVLNVLENAIKYSSGSLTPQVTVRLVQAGEECLVRIRDFGPGIAPTNRKKIFERFYRAEGELTRKTRGAGLGLAIAKMLADRMNMKIDIINHEPGTEFCLILPAPA